MNYLYSTKKEKKEGCENDLTQKGKEKERK